MIVLKIICLAITVITCVVNIVCLVKFCKGFMGKFNKIYASYGLDENEKYKGYDFDDNTVEKLKRTEVILKILFQQIIISVPLSIIGIAAFAFGIYGIGSMKCFTVFVLAGFICYFISMMASLYLIKKLAKKTDTYLYVGRMMGRGCYESIIESCVISFFVSFHLGAVIGIIPIILGL